MVSQMDLLLAPVFAWVLCAPKYLAGTMTLGELTQAAAAFVTLQTAFNWLVDNFQRFADWRAATNRVAALLLALDQLESGHEAHPPDAARPVHAGKERAPHREQGAESQA
jgi:vitamin B12/bleomycin/antimicrobial peptide transport system ATP-binding/permease protein